MSIWFIIIICLLNTSVKMGIVSLVTFENNNRRKKWDSHNSEYVGGIEVEYFNNETTIMSKERVFCTYNIFSLCDRENRMIFKDLRLMYV